jgi:ribosomal protein S27AE
VEQTQHRETYATFVREHAQGPYAAALTQLYALGQDYNDRHFAGQLVPPYVLLAEPSSPRAIGDWSRVSGSGLLSQIRIRPSILTGKHRSVREGDEYADGRFLYAADILLHEMIHQWHTEVTGQTEASMHGHGPAFRDMCNQIGRQLELSPVGTKRQKGLPACNQWPHNVRPPGYYLGALADTEAPTVEPEPAAPGAREYGAMFTAALAALDGAVASDVLTSWFDALPADLRAVILDRSPVIPVVPTNGDGENRLSSVDTTTKRGQAAKKKRAACPHCGATRTFANVHDPSKIYCYTCSRLRKDET